MVEEIEECLEDPRGQGALSEPPHRCPLSFCMRRGEHQEHHRGPEPRCMTWYCWAKLYIKKLSVRVTLA